MSEPSAVNSSRRPFVVVSLVLCLIFVFAWFIIGPVPNKIKSESLSPDGSLKAVVFEPEGDATAGSSIQISIVSSTGLIFGGGNIFIEDDNHGMGSLSVSVKWLSNNELEIGYDPKARIFKQENLLNFTEPFQSSREIIIRYLQNRP